MAQTVPVYVSINADNNTMTAQPVTDKADGLMEMWVQPVMLDYLMRNWQKYLVVNGMFKRTVDTLPDLSVDHLLHENESLSLQLNAANGTIKSQGDDITALKTDNTSLKQQLDLSQNAMLEISDYVFSQPTTSAADTATTAASSAATTAGSAADGEVK